MRTLSEKMECGKRYIKHPDYKIGLDMLQKWIDECKQLEQQLKILNIPVVVGQSDVKKFIYCEITDGGMESWEISNIEDLKGLYGWMTDGCKKDDYELVNWIEKANIGDYFKHRLGMCFRVNCA
jgi:hypothetical protein